MSGAGAQSGAFLAAAPDAALDAVALTAQVTLLLLLALALAWFGRRGASRTLHLLWTATFAFVLALPALGLLGPSWEVPLLRARGGEPAPASIPGSVEAAGRIPALEIDRTREALVLAERARLDARVGGAGSAPASAGTGRSAVRIAWIVWMMGCGLSLVSLAVAALRLRRLVRAARPVRDPEWVRQAEALRSRLGLRGEIRLLVSGAVTTPMTGGLRRPVILLPESAASWSRERRAVVLAHELVHVRRRDTLRQLIRRVVLALYWFHPLAWLASRRAALASEKACDEEVLAFGTRPSDYARHLLFLARGLSRGPKALALPIVHPSQLERRITSILARRRPRHSIVRTALTLTVIGAAGVSVAAARPVPVEDGAAATAALATVQSATVAAAATESLRDETGIPGIPEFSPGDAPPAPAALQEVECFSSTADSMRPYAIQAQGTLFPGWRWRDGEFTIEKSVADRRLCMRLHGDVEFGEDGTAVEALGEDSWVILGSRGEKTHRLVVTRGPNGIEREWSVDGARRPFDAEAREWRDLMFTVMRGYHEAWQPYTGAIVLYGRISGYRDRISALRSGMRDARAAEARARLERGFTELEAGLRRAAQVIEQADVEGRLREIAERIDNYDFAREVARIQADIEARTEAWVLDGTLAEIADQLQREIEAMDLESRMEEMERQLQDIIAELQRVTR
ncbi:M56 family metallopeptidase [Candidatus Palauibacter sp.]|uniref:M56 family metallopeptidase n=1 Tax=Candidatus Palauibacter sp. TaxID=3101350 RepID=UPI003AF30972